MSLIYEPFLNQRRVLLHQQWNGRMCRPPPPWPHLRVARSENERERVLYQQPTGPNPLYHRDDLVDRPRDMGV